MKFLAIIPARKGSKGIKIKILNCLMVNHLFIGLLNQQKSKYLDKIVVSTDSKKIKNFALKNDVLAPFIRPKNISHGKTKAHDVIIHAISYFKKKN